MNYENLKLSDLECAGLNNSDWVNLLLALFGRVFTMLVRHMGALCRRIRFGDNTESVFA